MLSERGLLEWFEGRFRALSPGTCVRSSSTVPFGNGDRAAVGWDGRQLMAFPGSSPPVRLEGLRLLGARMHLQDVVDGLERTEAARRAPGIPPAGRRWTSDYGVRDARSLV